MSAAPRSLAAQHPALEPHLRAGEDAQRARLLDAVLRVTAERGYAAASVADVVRAAGVSRSTFYELFASKEACLLAAYEHGVDVVIDRVRAAVRAATPDWRSRLRAGMRAYLHTLAADPGFARVLLLEIQAAGPAGLAARAAAGRRFADRYRATFDQAREARPELAPPPADALLLLCAGTDHLVADRVRAGDAARLGELEDVFCHCAEAVILGPAPAPHPSPGPTQED